MGIMKNSNLFERSDASQEEQYDIPYHYIPSLDNDNFTQHLYWSWGIHYLGGIDIVLSSLAKQPFSSLIDIGCGDGRLLREINKRFPGNRLQGIDYSSRAINLARAMNPDLSYNTIDICSIDTPENTFDVVTLVEVLEHIPTDSADVFLKSLSTYQRPGGKLILTVPHKNKPLQTKHYQHFDSDNLIELISPYYIVEDIIFFDKLSRIFSRVSNYLLGNNFFILNNRILLNTIFNIYRNKYLLCRESCCGRICLVCQKR